MVLVIERLASILWTLTDDERDTIRRIIAMTGPVNFLLYWQNHRADLEYIRHF